MTESICKLQMSYVSEEVRGKRSGHGLLEEIILSKK